MKLDKLFEKILSLFKKETSESEDSDSTSLRRSRSDRKKLAQVGPFLTVKKKRQVPCLVKREPMLN